MKTQHHRVTGLLCCLVLLTRAGRTTSRQISKFHESLAEDDLEGYFGTRDKRSVPDYDVVHPIHVTGSRYRRSLMSNKPPLEYQLDAFGEKYHLKLKHNNELIAPGCLVTLTGEGKGETTPCPVKEDNCYYHGYSINHNNSQAALSTCRGLHGIISTKEHQLVIQPIKYPHVAATNCKVTAPAPHLVYKLSDRSRRHCPLESSARHISKMVHHRARRQTHDLTIEMLLVADKTMYRHHGDDLTNYMLTAANVASARYLDYSLGVPIKLSIIRLRILQNDVTGLEIIPDADLTLTSFCEWQEKFNPPRDQDPQHVDAASLMTRTDLVHKGVKDTTGLASLGGMCVSKQRCSVLEDNGLDIGLTLAHETGHSLNMDHDSDGNICDDKKNIMSTGGAGGSTAFQWSRCSRESLLHFIFDGKTECLRDHPQGQVIALPRDMPGVLYPGDDQCRLFLGEGSRICLDTSLVEPYGGDECGKLVCFDPNLPGQCTGSQAPRMDGTECGNRKWCISGQCQDIGSDGPPAVDGGWSAWDNSQSECSRSCGGGVRVRSRKCDNPRPLFGGKKCEGFATKAVMCNFEPCSTSQETYKEEQCAATDRYPLHGFYKHWLPGDTIGESVCMLFCHPEGEETIHLRGVGASTLYQDGTQCSDAKGVYNRCVRGECRPFGCDGVSDSPARPDVCGVCQGHNNTCIKRKGSYFKGKVNVYITFLTLPKGSTGIKMTNDNRYTWMSIKVNGKRLFNTNGRQKDRKDIYKQDGVTVLYAPYRPESIQIEGPIPVEIEAQVYRVYGDAYEDVTPIIYYEYYEPLNNVASNAGTRFDATRPAAPEYKWMTIDGQCSVTCGQGSLRVGAKCVQISTSQRVDRNLCDAASEPRSYTKSCTEKACPSRWTVGSYSGCSKTCDGGLKTRSVQCVRSDGQTDRVVSDGQCGFNTRPSRTETCGTRDCPGEWATSRWSDCSVSCGAGTRHRQVGCFSPSDSRLEDSACIQRDRPSTQGSCNNGECPVVQSTPAVAGDGCHDNKTAECDSYRKEICTRYTEWARNHCPVYCGMCPVPEGALPVEAKAGGEATTKTGETVANQQQGRTVGHNTIGQNDEHIDSSIKETNQQDDDSDSNNEITTDKGQTGDSVDSRDSNEIVRGSSTKDNNEIVRDSSTKDNNGILGDSSTKDNNKVSANSVSRENNSNLQSNNEYSKDAKTSKSTVGISSSQTSTDAGSADETSGSCINRLDNCHLYTQKDCRQYPEWGNRNCRKYCNYCDVIETSTAMPTTKVDSTCKDSNEHCAEYDDTVCKDYALWARKNCRRRCRFCTEQGAITTTKTLATTLDTACTDVSSDCVKYDKSVCETYKTWAKNNCRHFCGLC